MSLVNKQELYELINDCDNDMLLAEVKELLKSSDIDDWWDDLTFEDKSLIMESEMQYANGNIISHNMLIQQFEEWKKK
jgi:hypothetical protein